MTVNDLIIAAMDFGIPCEPGIYKGTEDEYITFNYNSMPDDFGDDTPSHEINLVQVHYVCPVKQDSVARRKEIKQKLFAAGFTWPDMTDATDADSQHYVFECEIAEGV